MSLSFVPLGVGDAFSALYYSSCLALEYEGRWLLVDCPHPIRKMMREALGESIDLGDVEAVALTHLHADHASGLEGYGYFSYFALGRKARIATHPNVRKRLWDGHLAAGMERLTEASASDGSKRRAQRGFDDYFEYVPLDVERAVEVGPFTIECRMTDHHIATTAFRISAGGQTLGYSADTSFDPGLIAWLEGCDRFVHETNLGTHTPYEDLAALPAALREKMWLVHYPDSFDLAASVIEPLVQGRRYSLGASS